jgi:hypothetical protein
MDKIKLKKSEVRTLFFNIMGVIESQYRNQGLKHALSRTKRSLLPEIETIQDVEKSDDALTAYRKALSDEKAFDEKGNIINKAKSDEIKARPEFVEAIKKNEEYLKGEIEVEVHKIKFVDCAELNTIEYECLFEMTYPPEPEAAK